MTTYSAWRPTRVPFFYRDARRMPAFTTVRAVRFDVTHLRPCGCDFDDPAGCSSGMFPALCDCACHDQAADFDDVESWGTGGMLDHRQTYDGWRAEQGPGR